MTPIYLDFASNHNDLSGFIYVSSSTKESTRNRQKHFRTCGRPNQHHPDVHQTFMQYVLDQSNTTKTSRQIKNSRTDDIQLILPRTLTLTLEIGNYIHNIRFVCTRRPISWRKCHSNICSFAEMSISE